MLGRKYAVLFLFIAIGLYGTLFGLARALRETMLFGGLTVFLLALRSTAIYTYTPELYRRKFVRPAADDSWKTPHGKQGLNPAEETEYWRGRRGADRSFLRAWHAG